MSGSLHILLVDDNPDDRALAARELGREFSGSQFHAVTDARGLSQALDSRVWDLVITDYQLRWSDGVTVLVAVKVRHPECPVIMFTGSGNEEIAVQAMRAGLDDYVLKSPRHYARLAAAAVLAIERVKQRRALHDAETRFQSLFDDVPVGLFRVAQEGRIVDANPTLVEMLGYPDRETLQAARPLNVFADRRERRALLNELKRSGIVRLFEARFFRSDGRIIWAEVNARMVRSGTNDKVFYEGSLEDVTARKEAEQSLRESEVRKSAILNSALDAVITIDSQGCVTEFNPAAEKMFALARADVMGKEMAQLLIPPSLRERHRRGLERYLATGRGKLLGQRVEMKAMRAGGKEFPIELTITKASAEGPPMFTGFVRDITERKRVERQLHDSREQLRALAAYLQSVREEEQTRIAREVHDELGQAMTGLKLDLAWVEKKMAEVSRTEDLQQCEEKLKELPGRVDALIGTIRKIATELRPPVLDDLGLQAAILWQTEEFEKRTGIRCRLHSSLTRVDLDPNRATAVFRIFQETLTNIVRHAEASEVNVHLREEDDKLVLEVQDNGRGVTGRDSAASKSLGLLGMRERATMLDGEVNIISRQGRGTTVGVRIPIPRTAEHVEN